MIKPQNIYYVSDFFGIRLIKIIKVIEQTVFYHKSVSLSGFNKETPTLRGNLSYFMSLEKGKFSKNRFKGMVSININSISEYSPFINENGEIKLPTPLQWRKWKICKVID